jgi:hypothetical protein
VRMLIDTARCHKQLNTPVHENSIPSSTVTT